MITDARRSPLAVVWTALLVAVCTAPLLYLVSVSLMGRDDLAAGVLVPAQPRWDNWIVAITSSSVLASVAASVLTAASAVALTLTIAVPAAWSLVRHHSGSVLSNFIVSPWLLPPIVAVIPLFFLLRVLGLTNSLFGLILLYGLLNVPVAVWLLQGFTRRIPLEVEEAAALDGAGMTTLLARIVVPLLWPAIVSVSIVVGILNYNEFLLATFLLQDPNVQTMPVMLSLYYGDRIPHLGRMAAASLIAIVPVLIVAGLLQRRLIGGLASAAHLRG